ncbi:hypothetical protein HOU43_gp35 [Cronobacter phage CS01]|uniref:dATP/dGTP diphosphohydrolase MazZ domain-containing protein n=1 Tax=Cronobacter phage CS01 TaxID=2496544 RepID=A0A3B8DJD0_9CAUD|nr:hypothetical protein HOU43_gp35 [Cronobacter phage CS01]AYJ73323.1 hypothetical protein CS01_035 [Cronobacter phage CS01]
MKSLKLDLQKLSPEAIDRIIEAARNEPGGNIIAYTTPPAPAVPEIITTLERQCDDLLAALESLVLFTNPKPSNAAALNNAHQVIARTKGRAMQNQADKAAPPKSELAQRASQILADATELANRISAQVGNEYQQFASLAETGDQARYRVRIEHANWSQETFGAAGPIGPLKHLAKEAIEAAENPGDLFEWADMQFLLWDAQRRAGITDEQITKAMIEKLAVNKSRKWPEPKYGEPRHHIKDSAE